MIEIGRLCIKIAGRDAGLKCVIVDILDNKFVLIDGQTRRRKCNILHLEPLKEVIKIKKNASHEDIKKEFKKLNLKARDTKPKQKTDRPRKQRKTSKQLRDQKTEKKKEKVISKKKEKPEGKKEESLEEKASLSEKDKKEKSKKPVKGKTENKNK